MQFGLVICLFLLVLFWSCLLSCSCSCFMCLGTAGYQLFHSIFKVNMKLGSKKRWKSLVPLRIRGKSATRFCIFPKVRSAGHTQGNTPVYLNVYDLTPMNGYVYWAGLGIFHSGVEGNSNLFNSMSKLSLRKVFKILVKIVSCLIKLSDHYSPLLGWVFFFLEIYSGNSQGWLGGRLETQLQLCILHHHNFYPINCFPEIFPDVEASYVMRKLMC